MPTILHRDIRSEKIQGEPARHMAPSQRQVRRCRKVPCQQPVPHMRHGAPMVLSVACGKCCWSDFRGAVFERCDADRESSRRDPSPPAGIARRATADGVLHRRHREIHIHVLHQGGKVRGGQVDAGKANRNRGLRHRLRHDVRPWTAQPLRMELAGGLCCCCLLDICTLPSTTVEYIAYVYDHSCIPILSVLAHTFLYNQQQL